MNPYSPAPAPTDPADIPRYVAQELTKIQQSLQAITEMLTPRTAAPTRYKSGDIFLADGVNWDPLTLAGTVPYWVTWNGSAFAALG